MLMTSAPPIAIGLMDQCCCENTRLKYPALYRDTQNSDFFNHRVFWRWIAFSLVHSVVLFWGPMLAFNGGTAWPSGRTSDYLALGNTVYTCVMITVCLKAWLELHSWNLLTHLAIFGSIGVWLLFLCVYSYFWPLGHVLAPDMTGMIVMVVSTPAFWLCIVLAPVTALIFDLTWKFVVTSRCPSTTDKIRMAEDRRLDPVRFVESFRYSRDQRQNTRSSAARDQLARSAGSLQDAIGLPVGHGPGLRDQSASTDRGFAFSIEEGGAVTQAEYIRRYDDADATKHKRPRRNGGTYQDG